MPIADVLRGLAAVVTEQLLWSTVVCAAVLLLTTVLRRLGQTSPRLHAGLWSLVFLRLVLPTDLSFAWSARALLEERTAWASPTVLDGWAAAAPVPVPVAVSEAPATVPASFDPALLLVIVWLVCVLALAVRYALNCRRYRALAAAGRAVTGGELAKLAESWRKQLRIRRPVQLVLAAGCRSPFTLGWRRPAIVLPASLGDWAPAALEPVVAHEMTHIRRWDLLQLRLQSWLEIVYFFHPAVWIAGRRLRAERELCCDLQALAGGRLDPDRYSRSLFEVLRLERQGRAAPSRGVDEWPEPVPGFGRDYRRLNMRFRWILDTGRRRSPSRLVAWTLTLAAAVLLLPLAAVPTAVGAPSDFSAASSTSALSVLSPSPWLQAGPWMAHPVPEGRMASAFGKRWNPVREEMDHHNGVDLAAKVGTGIVAPASGRVVLATERYEGGESYGTVILIDHGDGLETFYAHLHALRVEAGQQVTTGQVIGEVGTTGQSTGPHLHFEVRRNGDPVDPRDMVRGFEDC